MSRVYSILIDKKYFDIVEAAKWIEDNNFTLTNGIELKDDHYEFIQNKQSKCSYYIIKYVCEGIRFIIENRIEYEYNI